MRKNLLSSSKNKKIRLSKEQQKKMLVFFAKTSIPRMIQTTNNDAK